MQILQIELFQPLIRIVKLHAADGGITSERHAAAQGTHPG